MRHLDYEQSLTCEACEKTFQATLEVDRCPDCRGGKLEFVCTGPGIYAADSIKMPGRRYICHKASEGIWHVNLGTSPVHRRGGVDQRMPFGGLHSAKEWCRDFEERLVIEDEEAGELQ